MSSNNNICLSYITNNQEHKNKKKTSENITILHQILFKKKSTVQYLIICSFFKNYASLFISIA